MKESQLPLLPPQAAPPRNTRDLPPDFRLYVGDNKRLLPKLLPDFRSAFKMVYIDPPYNTGTAKSYQDNFKSEGWLGNMETALANLREVLRNDGVLFISIDDGQYAELKILCDQLFGKSNFCGTFITRQAQRSNSRLVNTVHEYVLCYGKDSSKLGAFSISRMDIPEDREMIEAMERQVGEALKNGQASAEKKLRELIGHFCAERGITWLKNYCNVDEAGKIYFASDLSVPGTPRRLDIDELDLHLKPLKTRAWATEKRFLELHRAGRLVFRDGRPYQKKYLGEARDSAPSILNFYSRFGSRDLSLLGLRDIFDTPKPVELIKFLLRISGVQSGDYVLDSFAGSGATAQAVLEVNREDGKAISCFLMQTREPVRKNTKSHKACLAAGIEPIISEITALRFSRVCERLGLENTLRVIADE